MTQGGIVHVLDFATKALRLVTRSTFSAELLGACDSFDLGLMILYILNEIHRGVPSKLEMLESNTERVFDISRKLKTK